MTSQNKISSLISKIHPFKGFLDGQINLEKAKAAATIKRIEQQKQIEIEKIKIESIQQIEAVKSEIPALVQSEVEKVKTMDKNEAMRWRIPFGYNQATNPDRKLGSDIPFSYLRRMAVLYPIARACINRRVRQITQLDWDVTTIDEIENEDGYKSQINKVLDWLKQPMGHKTRMREMLTMMVDDILTVDATCFEMRRRMNGDFMNLVPVDPTTIILRVTESGGTPEPPEIAYAQYIAGKKVAEFTTNEMIYEAMNNRSYLPYGLAPLESLILQVESALRGTLFNLGYFRENNIPEGFITLPEEIATSKDQVEEWQMWFDAILAGDTRMVHRLKILPGGATYTPAKKPEDMAFEKFELWLLQQTCAVFDVPPQDIGITYQVNKATGEVQSQLSNEKGLYPLSGFVKEVLDDIIQVELGFPQLQFNWRNLDPVDLKEEVEIAQKEVEMGALSVDEYRIEHGREPIGLGHYVKTSQGPILVKDVINPPQQDNSQVNVQEDKTKDEEKKIAISEEENSIEVEKMEIADLRRWRKCLYHDLEAAKPLRTRFPSEHIRPEIHKTLEEGLNGVNSRLQIKLLFDQFLDPKIKAAMELLQRADEMKEEENEST